ncbi:MAG: phage minor capsid protein [Butyricicoccus porcorum]
MIDLYSQVERDILADMARRISQYNYWISAVEHQRQMLREMGLSQKHIIRVLSQISGKSQGEIKRLMQQACDKALESDQDYYRQHGFDAPSAKSAEMKAILNAGLKSTKGLFKNLTKTTASAGQAQFVNALDKAWLQINSGAFDYNTAIRNAVKDITRQGLQAVRYPSGHADTLEVAVRRAVVTGVNQTAGRLQWELAEELGCDLVETTAHAGARPEHAAWQGQIFSRSGKHPKYPDFISSTGYGTGPGLCGWNCRHSFNPYVEGSPRAYGDKLLEDYNAKKYTYNGKKLTEYEACQLQRYHERQIRRWKRENIAMQAAGLDTYESAAKIRSWQERQKDFIRQTGLKRQSDREQIASFGGSQARKAAHEAELYYQLWSKSIGVNDAVKTLAKYYDIKYNNSPTYKLLQRYARDVEAGWISPNADFGNYLKQYNRIQNEIVGTKTKNGINITGQSQHFMQRVLGTGADPGHGGVARSGVSVDDIIDALQNGAVRPARPGANGGSQKFTSPKCDVSINPRTGILIQCNPK